jgi:polyhydroxybutyrate depolymerase
MRGRRTILAVVLVLIGLPEAWAVISAVSFELRNANNGALISSGRRREYLLHLPRGHDQSKPMPLVISLHGAGGWPMQQATLTRWDRLADREGFAVVYPEGGTGGGPRVWKPDDVQFLSDLIASLERSHNIDRNRIYVNGLSNGGGMSFVLSCRLAERIAAGGMVAPAQTVHWNWCGDDHPIPMMMVHGTADPMIPYRGGKTWVAPLPFPDVESWVGKWAQRNRCESPVVTSQGAKVVRREYQRCANDAAVVLYTVVGGGHTWPGGEDMPEWFVGPNSHEIDATEELWKFFSTKASKLTPRPSVSTAHVAAR